MQRRTAKQRQILGMDDDQPETSSQSAEREVDLYLNDREKGTGTLEFWQVSSCVVDQVWASLTQGPSGESEPLS